MDKLQSISLFVAVAREGNFSAAAKAVGLSSVMVGKHIRQLESSLGVKLIHRNTRRQSLTEAGCLFLDDCLAILERLRTAESVGERLGNPTQGRIRISAPVTFGASVIAQALAEFATVHSNVRLELKLQDEVVDLIAGGYDLAIRIGPLKSSDSLVARPLAPYVMVLCASPDYLARCGCPASVAELSDHTGLRHLLWTDTTGWRSLKDGDSIDIHRFASTLSSNNSHALRVAALQGTGIVMLPRTLLEDDIRAGRLVPLLADHLPQPRPIHLVYPYDSNPLPKLRRLVKFLTDRLGPPARANLFPAFDTSERQGA